MSETIRVVACATPEAEAEWAAREIRRYVRESGCRYRDVAVLVRSLEPYHDSVRRVFTRYEIPMFLDRRESVSHHPLAELTRYALRLAAFYWEHDDWFGALKTGLAPATDWEIDRLENEALSKGWRGRERWSMPIENAEWLERPRQKVVPPFARFVDALSSSGGKLDGVRLASALRQLWQALGVNRTLERWSSASATLDGLPNPALHETVWQQMLDWLRNIEMAFESASIPLEGWLPIVEAGISNLSAGVIPPSLDQVLVGAIDRSRNPDLKLAIVLGMNEGVFPAPPTSPVLLTRVDREILNSLDAALGPDHWQQAALERYYGYIAMTRSRERLFLTFARRDGQGHELNPSAFIGELKLLCRDLRVEDFAEPESGAPEHWTELAHPLSHNPQPERRAWYLHGGEQVPGWVNAFEQALEAWQIVANPKLDSRLDSALVEAIYGNELQTSVSALEQFAECPFHFFAARGLRALDRPEFEIDRRERGSLQHEILKQFHLNLAREGKKWRDVPPDEARLRIREIGERLIPQYRDGLFAASSTRQFTARVLIENLERVVAVLCGWAAQCGFDPAAVEASFGLSDSVLGGWRIDLENGHALVLRGRIDRVDVCRLEDGAALALVVDYKSSARELDPVLLEHGIELQLIAYLAALSEVGQIEGVFGASRLIPAGAFYIPLRGAGESLRTRNEERAEGAGRAPGYQHRGRFNAAYLDRFDTRGASKGEQFRFTLTKAGVLSKSGNEALNPAEFDALVRRARSFLETHGRDIYSGNVGAAPFRSTKRSACDHCDYRPVCRFDPWTQPFRVLRRGQKEKPDEADR